MVHSSVFRCLKLLLLKTFFNSKFLNPVSVACDYNRIAICQLDLNSGLVKDYNFFTSSSDQGLNLNLAELYALKVLLQLYRKYSLSCNMSLAVNDILLKVMRIAQDPITTLYDRVYNELSLALLTDDIMFDYIITAEANTEFVLQAAVVKKAHLAQYYKFAQEAKFYVAKITIDAYSITKLLQGLKRIDDQQSARQQLARQQRLLRNNIIFLKANPVCLAAIIVVDGKYQNYQQLTVTTAINESIVTLLDNIKSYLMLSLNTDSWHDYQLIIADELANDIAFVEFIDNLQLLAVNTFGTIYQQLCAEKIAITELNLLYSAISLSEFWSMQYERV